MAKLSKAPLQEVLFEVKWDLEQGIQGITTDPGFALAQGKFQEKVRARFPHFVRKTPPWASELVFPYQVINQHWASEQEWPVVQLGPGILAVNDTELNYEWESNFLPMVQFVLHALKESYDTPLDIQFAGLRYIDAVKMNNYGKDLTPLEFVNQHFNIELKRNYYVGGASCGLHFEEVVDMDNQTKLKIAINSGKYRRTDNDAIIWQTSLEKHSSFDLEQLLSWLEEAHTVSSSLFKSMLKPAFYASFS
jgi:uncharacterized protein (TIGR04255 family)